VRTSSKNYSLSVVKDVCRVAVAVTSGEDVLKHSRAVQMEDFQYGGFDLEL